MTLTTTTVSTVSDTKNYPLTPTIQEGSLSSRPTCNLSDAIKSGCFRGYETFTSTGAKAGAASLIVAAVVQSGREGSPLYKLSDLVVTWMDQIKASLGNSSILIPAFEFARPQVHSWINASPQSWFVSAAIKQAALDELFAKNQSEEKTEMSSIEQGASKVASFATIFLLGSLLNYAIDCEAYPSQSFPGYIHGKIASLL